MEQMDPPPDPRLAASLRPVPPKRRSRDESAMPVSRAASRRPSSGVAGASANECSDPPDASMPPPGIPLQPRVSVSASTTGMAAKNAHRSQRSNLEKEFYKTQSHLTQRLYTFTPEVSLTSSIYRPLLHATSLQTGPDVPQFKRLRSAPAALSQSDLSVPVSTETASISQSNPNLESRASTPHLIAHAAEKGVKTPVIQRPPTGLSSGSSTPRVILRAKKPLILPISSTPGHSVKQSHLFDSSRPTSQQTFYQESSGDGSTRPATASIDAAALQEIIRPKRGMDLIDGVDDLDRLGLGHTRSAFSSARVVPPIRSSMSAPSRTSLEQNHSVTSADSKRVRLIVPDAYGTHVDAVELQQNNSSARSESAVVASAAENEAGSIASGRSPGLRERRKKSFSFLLGHEENNFSPFSMGRTPFDFIRYMEAKETATKEFAYLNAVKPSVKRGNLVYNPYNLEIIEYKNIDKEDGYYTISSRGITKFNSKGHGEFTPTSQWLREHELFHKLLRIPFFARYRIWKCFTVWHRTVLHTKISKAKKMLAQSLFIAHPFLRPVLLEVQSLCVGFAKDRSLVNIEGGKTYELEEFVRTQSEWVTGESVSCLKQCETQIRQIVERAATQCLNDKGFDITLKVKDENEQDNALKGISNGPKLSFTEQSSRRNECSKLRRFVKTVDYMIVNTLHMLVIDGVMELLKIMFSGCDDSDVVVDGYDGTDVTRDQQIGQLMTVEKPIDNSPSLQEIVEESRKSLSASNLNANSSHLESVITTGTVQVGGAVVGPDVKTSELLTCGFDGFMSILSRIFRAPMVTAEFQELNDTDEVLEVDNVHSTKHTEKKRDVQQKQGQQPLFKVQLLLHRKSRLKHLYFEPSLPDFLNAIDELLKSYILSVQEFTLLTGTIPFLDPSNLAGGAYSAMRGLDETEFSDGPQITGIVVESGYFREICGRIRGVIVGMFLNATEWMHTFEDVREMWIENLQFDAMQELQAAAGPIAGILAMNGSNSDTVRLQSQLLEYENQLLAKAREAVGPSGERAIPDDRKRGVLEIASTIEFRMNEDESEHAYSALAEFFDIMLGKFDEQRQAMSNISVSSVINNFSIDTSVLKSVLMPSPERCFSDVARILPGLARDKNELLLSELQSWVKTLNTQPQTVEGFVEYLGWLEKIKGAMKLVEASNDEVVNFYNQLDLYKIPIQPTDLALFQTLSPTLHSLQEAADMASDTKEESISKFSAELEKAVIELMGEVSDVRNKAQDPMVLDLSSNSDVVISFMNDLISQLQNIEARKLKYESWAELFKRGGVSQIAENQQEIKKKPSGGELEDTFTEVRLKNTLWVSLKEWSRMTEDWKSQPFDALNVEEVNTQIQAFSKTVYLLDKGLPPNDVVPKLKAKVDEYRIMYPTIMDLRNPALKARHWEKIQDALGKTLIKDETFTLGRLVELRVFDFKEEISNVSSQAGSEAALEEMLGKVVRNWNEAEFVVLNYRDAKDVFILGTVEDIQTLLEDSQVTIATIKSSRFIGPIKVEVDRWDKQLALFTETLDAWLTCQRNWLYLESIFSAPDIQRQLPDEARMFAQVDRSWKDIMRRASRNPNAIKAGTLPGLLETLQQNNILLDQIQKCLEDYLESKRLLFPRFYFLSNDELLEILSQTRNPQAVQPHLSKCFDAIKSLEFASNDIKSTDILAMVSPEGERVPFSKTIKARGNVEAWLGSVEEGMFGILRRLVKIAISDYENAKRSDWVKEHIGQVVITGNQIIWSRDVSDAIKSANPEKALLGFKQESINNLSALAGLVRGELTSIQRAVIGALITIDVHNRDIVQGLCLAKVSGLADFEWVKQLRYYWDMDLDTCSVKMSSSVFSYGYEYLGAMQLNLGGSPVGPAGTGKTETVKDLAKALARQCVVFNCSDGLDYKMMGKMFAGLAQSGAWACFDEFNRIDIEVLSVIAQQLLTIKAAKDVKALRFNFEGREIRLIDTCSAFITMNPGYAGRTELPDNLKALFRPISMMIPDYGLIAEIMLFSEGFESAKRFAGKVVNLYKLCSEQLSQQDHYDFGMRAVKSVLIMAGALKRSSPELPEEVVLIRSLRDSNLPKFLEEDVCLFSGILQDLFPGVTIVEKDFSLLVGAFKEVMAERSLEVVDPFVTRICQLYETMRIRHGVMLVGIDSPTGGGKTTCYQILRDANTLLNERYPSSPEFQKVKTWVLNPKCVAMTELYGQFNLATMEWKDGLIGSIFREQVADESPDEKWTVLDGPVDALWIENMNTVLDDNKLLTLINGERIKMNSTMHMLFEVMDLAVASPATVSRCGMVYMDPVSLGWMSTVKSWLRKMPEYVPEELKEHILTLIEQYIEKGLRFVRKYCGEFVPSVNVNLVTSFCNLLSSFINRKSEIDYKQDAAELKPLFSCLFVFCYAWSIGGNLSDGYQEKFDTFLRDMIENNPISEFQLPSSNSIFAHYVDFKTKQFVVWEEMVPQFTYNREIPYFQMIVPTSDTVKYAYLLESLLTNGFRTLFTGGTGVGKSVIVQDLLNRISKQKGFVPVTLNFSAQTNSEQTQQMMELKLEKKRKNISGAPTGLSKIVLFVDDLNMPKLDTYGSQPPIELLRQYIDFGGFYDREKLTWKVVQDIEIVACCGPPGGGRNNVTPRFLRHFNMLNIPAPSESSLSKIFKSIVDGFLKPFSNEVKVCTDAIVNSAIEIYHSMCTQLLPTPAKSHYTFNLRDLSKVVQGILQFQPANVPTKADMAKAFIHESSRVFHDRLIDDTDRIFFFKLVSELVDRNFGVNIPKDILVEKPIIFGDFSKRGVAVEDRQYIEFTDMKVMNVLLEEYLEEYNVTMSKDVRLIFFMDAKQHISRISRIIRQPRGNALLVGVGGTGKQSLTRLACQISDYQCIQIELTRTYDTEEWREDLKKLYRSAGVEGKNTVFLLTDTQIKKETFLEDINSILNSGEVPNLFEIDEREKILGDLRPIAREKGIAEDRDSVYQFFINRCRDNLHIVLATSPVGDSFRNRCRMFPSLVNCSTIDWFDEWPKDALLSVSRRFFEFVDLGSDEMREKISNMCVEIHASVGQTAKKFYAELRRKYYTTPTSYLELINLYTSMLHEKRKELGTARDRLKNGLNKLFETNDLVARMQVELEELGPELKQKAFDVEALMVKIAKDQETADGVRKVVSDEEVIVRDKANVTESIAAEAQKDLDEALPALQAAYRALDALEKKDIAELKVFTKPPDLVLLVMEAICILFKSKPDWESSKKLLSDPQLMKKMQDFDKDNIPETTTKKLRKYIENPSFNPEAVERVSKACKSMCMWVIAMDIYSRVYKEVLPKKKRLEEAQATLEITREKLAEKTAALQEVEDQLNQLKNTYEASIRSKRQLSDKMDETTRRLTRASKLTEALADEQVRWAESVESLTVQIDALVGNMFLCAASVAYCGAFTSHYRNDLTRQWMNKCQDMGIPVSENFNILDHLADPAVVRDWNIQGLPSDQLSVENGILVTRGRRWPLMIDPQSQANRWIRSMEGTNLKIIKMSDSKFLRSLENAVRTGQAVLMEDVGEQLDPAIEPLLLKQTLRQGGRLLMKLGDSLVEYDRNFKLYITTKLANPHYLPEVCIKVTIINFTVTKAGLDGQLLADVVKLERPELEEQRNTLIVNIALDKRQLKDIEEKILKLLFNSEGNILDDEELINTLNQSKVTSAAIKERVNLAEQTEVEINAARERYRPVSIRGSVLYFVIADLAELDPMYQFSLKYFKNLFNQCILESEKSDDLQTRILILCRNATYSIFANVSRGLFEVHKLIYSFMICIAILRQRESISEDEWNFFIRGSNRLNGENPPRPQSKIITDTIWNNLCDMGLSVSAFGYIEEHMKFHVSEWEEFMDGSDPYSSQIPSETSFPLTDFQRLMIVKVMCEEKLVQAITQFVCKNLGQEFIDVAPLDLVKVYKDTTNVLPMIFILSSGSDPISGLMKLAASKDFNMQDRLHMISLGQGQGPIAEEMIRRATQRGDWLFLQNCHLAASWMGKLETIIKNFGENEINQNFRLFLSSMPSKVFPASVLQDGVKVTNEPPKGLRANIARSFADISKDLFDVSPPQGVKFKKLLFGVCFFNAIIHERKKFGPLGWNILYDWSNSDLEVSITILKNTLTENRNIPWDALLYLTGEITFGGRVTDDWDRRTVRSVLSKYYTPKILEEQYKFTESGVYYAPADGDLNSFKAYIESMPLTEEPSIFGMHENANISYQMQESRRIVRTVLDVQPRLVSSGGGKTSEDVVTEIATSILENLPELLYIDLYALENALDNRNNTIDLFAKGPDGRMLNSLSTVLIQESNRFNKLLKVVSSSLEQLSKAVKGFIVMSSELELVYQSLLNNEVPKAWTAVAYPSLKPLAAWIKDLQLRVSELSAWIDNGQPPCFWLPGFFFPQGFLTGVLQNMARKYNIPIDSLAFAYKVSAYEDGDERIKNDASVVGTKKISNSEGDGFGPANTYPDEDGVLIRGLYIEGARWDREKRVLQDSFPMEMFSVKTNFIFELIQIQIWFIEENAIASLYSYANSTAWKRAVCLPSIQDICTRRDTVDNWSVDEFHRSRQHPDGQDTGLLDLKGSGSSVSAQRVKRRADKRAAQLEFWKVLKLPKTFSFCQKKKRTVKQAEMGGDHQQGPFTPMYFIKGALAGGICCGVTHGAMTPVDVVKTRIQLEPKVYNKGMIGGFRQIIANEGAGALLTGFGPTALGYFVQGWFKFGGVEFFKVQATQLLGDEAAWNNRVGIYLGAAAAAEFVADIFLCPLEATRIRLVSDPKFASGLADAFPKIIKQDGVIRGFYSGFGPILFKQIPYTMAKFAVQGVAAEQIYAVLGKNANQLSANENLGVSLGSGVIAGVAAAIISHPADTLLSMVNKEGAGGNGSITSRLWNLARETGVVRLCLNGLGPRCVMIGVLTAGQFALFDTVMAATGAKKFHFVDPKGDGSH
ncbi:Dynein heavy chain 6, axonemal [Entophlyctis luteolus]|nr:Dynein heavy chain 6, axonemal [Entophlyctis luteolus]